MADDVRSTETVREPETERCSNTELWGHLKAEMVAGNLRYASDEQKRDKGRRRGQIGGSLEN